MLDLSITYKGRELNTLMPKAQGLALHLLAWCLGLLGVAALVVACTLSLPLHLLLKAAGRQGFMRTQGSDRLYFVSARGFTRR